VSHPVVRISSFELVWPNGADLDPLVLHSKLTGQPIVLDIPDAQAG
jgi:hypothetical protein